jgi:hypothetical protein
MTIVDQGSAAPVACPKLARAHEAYEGRLKFYSK